MVHVTKSILNRKIRPMFGILAICLSAFVLVDAAGTRKVTRRRVEVPVSVDSSSVIASPFIDLNSPGVPSHQSHDLAQGSDRRLSTLADVSSNISSADDPSTLVRYSRRLLTGNPLAIETLVSLYEDLNSLYIFMDPENGTFSPTGDATLQCLY
jgi:hypothetical protein